MSENVKRLLTLIEQNPDLPIVPMVDAEICGDDYGTYMGGWGAARVDEYIISKGDDLVLFKSDDDVFGVLKRVLTEDEFKACPMRMRSAVRFTTSFPGSRPSWWTSSRPRWSERGCHGRKSQHNAE